jgi:hypothetical protein
MISSICRYVYIFIHRSGILYVVRKFMLLGVIKVKIGPQKRNLGSKISMKFYMMKKISPQSPITEFGLQNLYGRSCDI